MFRSKTDSIFGGVCGGIAKAVEMNPWAVRGLAVILALAFHWIAVVAYCIAWACIPREL